MIDREKEKARYARYRARRREKIGLSADRERARIATRKTYFKNAAKIRARKRGKVERDAARRAKSKAPRFLEDSAFNLRVVTDRELRLDTTRWRGPREREERRLERAADALLRKAEARRPSDPGETALRNSLPPGVEEPHTNHKRWGFTLTKEGLALTKEGLALTKEGRPTGKEKPTHA